MAATLTNDNEILYSSFPIEKTETTEDGDLIVYGKASDGGLDSDSQIVDPKWMAKAAQEWLSTGGNLRVQHSAQRDPAGVGLEATTDDSGSTWVKGLVVEPVAQKLVSKGALRAYSVGIARPTITRDASAPGGRIIGGELVEISLVDRPANKRCGIQLVKSASDGTPEYVGEVFGSEEDISKALGADTVKNYDADGEVPESSIPLAQDTVFSFTPNDLAKIVKSKVIEEHYAELAMKAIGDAEYEILGKDHREFTTDRRKDLAGQGNALPDGSYPIPDKDALRRAAILARSGHGNAAAARRLIARRAKELGVANPLDADDKVKNEDVTTAPVAEPEVPKEADADVTKDPADGDGPGPVDKKKPKKGKNGKPLPPWLQDNKGNSKSGDSPSNKQDNSGDGDDADDDDDDKKDMDCKLQHTHTEKCHPSGTPQSTSGAKDSPPMKEIPDPGAAEYTPMPAGRATEHHKGANPEQVALMRFKSVGMDPDLGRLHDLTCAAFHPEDVAKYHPFADFASTIDTGVWQRKAVDAACGPLDQAMAMTQVWQAAETLKGADLADLNDYRLALHKAFRDANPGPSSYPSPGSISPDRYNRPLITDGHETSSPGHDGPNSSPDVASHAPSGGDHFDRPPLGEGHQSPSPSFMKGGFPYPTEQGVPTKVPFAHAEKERARQALSLMHDHLARMFPSACPMHEQDPHRVDQRPAVPEPVGKTVEPEAQAEAVSKSETPGNVFKAEVGDDEVIKGIRKKLAKKVLSGKLTVDEARAKLGRARAQKSDEPDENVVKGLFETGKITREEALKQLGLQEPAAPAPAVKAAVPDVPTLTPDIIKSAITEAIAPIAQELAKARETIDEQQKALDVLADQPDPSTAAFAGIAVNKSSRPAGVPTQAEIAERTQTMVMRQLDRAYRTSENPAEREAAFQALSKYRAFE